ncbi:Kinesin-like protein Klp68D [Tetrabaena socialis]|uniref:Kinesin-like protein Klp68D n=1 Tax=Tetrabaena socialis TaxID=47790 RepID=A0A2J8AH40_9CHLO|nr:Kinesin-like protein Klp68D [Tetrabaena socialis]|eukprot:PNH11830.1 Kinesin-like protein Klp68D [Tetrabaena socialis]
MGTEWANGTRGVIPETLAEVYRLAHDSGLIVKLGCAQIYESKLETLTRPPPRANEPSYGPTPLKALPAWSVRKAGGRPPPTPFSRAKTACDALGVPGPLMVDADSLDVALRMLRDALKERNVGATNCNSNSSRGHFLVAVELWKPGEPAGPFARLKMVDLAGYDSSGKTGATGRRQDEAAHNNQGLLAVNRVLSALSCKQQASQMDPPRVPYRDNLLTRVLQDTLDGTSQTLFIACINASDCKNSIKETLRYTESAGRIKDAPMAAGHVQPQEQAREQARAQTREQELLDELSKARLRAEAAEERFRVEARLREEAEGKLRQAKEDNRSDYILSPGSPVGPPLTPLPSLLGQGAGGTPSCGTIGNCGAIGTGFPTCGHAWGLDSSCFTSGADAAMGSVEDLFCRSDATPAAKGPSPQPAPHTSRWLTLMRLSQEPVSASGGAMPLQRLPSSRSDPSPQPAPESSGAAPVRRLSSSGLDPSPQPAPASSGSALVRLLPSSFSESSPQPIMASSGTAPVRRLSSSGADLSPRPATALSGAVLATTQSAIPPAQGPSSGSALVRLLPSSFSESSPQPAPASSGSALVRLLPSSGLESSPQPIMASSGTAPVRRLSSSGADLSPRPATALSGAVLATTQSASEPRWRASMGLLAPASPQGACSCEPSTASAQPASVDPLLSQSLQRRVLGDTSSVSPLPLSGAERSVASSPAAGPVSRSMPRQLLFTDSPASPAAAASPRWAFSGERSGCATERASDGTLPQPPQRAPAPVGVCAGSRDAMCSLPVDHNASLAPKAPTGRLWPREGGSGLLDVLLDYLRWHRLPILKGSRKEDLRMAVANHCHMMYTRQGKVPRRVRSPVGFIIDIDDDSDDDAEAWHKGRGGRSGRRSMASPRQGRHAEPAGGKAVRTEAMEKNEKAQEGPRRYSDAAEDDDDEGVEEVKQRRSGGAHSFGGGAAGAPSLAPPAAGCSGKVKAGRTKPVPNLGLEAALLQRINLKRSLAGHEAPLAKLTVPVLVEALEGSSFGGKRWVRARKNRAALIEDYRKLLGLGLAGEA